MMRILSTITVWILLVSIVHAQSFTWISSTESKPWKSSQIELQGKVADTSVALNKEYVIVVGNLNDNAQAVTIGLGEKTLKVTLPGHSFNTFIGK